MNSKNYKNCCQLKDKILREIFTNPPLSYEAINKYELEFLIPFRIIPKSDCSDCQYLQTELDKQYQNLEKDLKGK